MTDDLRARARKIGKAVDRFAASAGVRGASGGVRFTVIDDSAKRGKGLDRIFVGLGATLDAFPEALQSAVPTIRAAHRANFTSEGASGRGAWDPLSPWTLRERARLGFPPGPILRRTGALQAHVLTAPAQIVRRGRDVELRIAPTPSVGGVPKYRMLALGGTTPTGGHVPGRPMVTLGPAAANRVTSKLSRSLRQIAARNGLG